MNLQIGVLGFVTWAAYLIIFGFLVRGITSRYPDSTVSKAIAFIY
ncbi:hypothetical protein Toil_gp13 [Rhodococcus phage Toil]|jgi:hypothetical protein|uniref:Uncharacterized protein n=1 Tax=Rhodococcus phage Toil TaxID=1975614 RepID=A0A1W6DXW4_9VIRU|nr:hypothetical protein KMD62_gp13 [Rhodococcus phage Toil]ARK07696.1 hypothetical protein Toil_gp13 [Rhodococcus phage Toil]